MCDAQRRSCVSKRKNPNCVQLFEFVSHTSQRYAVLFGFVLQTELPHIVGVVLRKITDGCSCEDWHSSTFARFLHLPVWVVTIMDLDHKQDFHADTGHRPLKLSRPENVHSSNSSSSRNVFGCFAALTGLRLQQTSSARDPRPPLRDKKCCQHCISLPSLCAELLPLSSKLLYTWEVR